MAETQTAAKERSAPKSLAEKEAEFTEWKAQRAVRDLRKAVKVELAVLAKKLDECKEVAQIGIRWDGAVRRIEAIVKASEGVAPKTATPDP